MKVINSLVHLSFMPIFFVPYVKLVELHDLLMSYEVGSSLMYKKRS